MADVTSDGQAFLVERRRVFPVGGTLHHAASPASEWPRRLAAARRAGLNCVETAVPWLLHEPAPGEFDFSGRADLARFLRLAGEAGLFVRLRMGPYVGAGFGGGGLPAWLPEVPVTKKSGPMKARESSDPFMAACTRWYTRLMQEVAPLQVSTSRPPAEGQRPARADAALGPASGYLGEGGGPVLAMQVEHRWLCHNPTEHANYHRTLVRFLLEGGAGVPITAANQLWQPVDGAVQTWSAAAGTLTDPEDPGIAGVARQLVAVQPGRPRIVEVLPAAGKRSAEDEAVAVAEALATGAMPHLGAFGGGRRLGFDGGPAAETPPDAYLLDAGGQPRAGLGPVRNLLSFASNFAGVFAGAEAAGQPPVLRPSAPSGVSLLPLEGEAGGVLFVFRSADHRADAADVLLPDGRGLRVPMPGGRVTWVAMNLRLGARGTLNHASLPVLGFFHGSLLVLCGAAGARGELELNGARHELNVPAADAAEPAVVRLNRDLAAVVLNEAQSEAFAVVEEGVCVGVDPFGVTADGDAPEDAAAADRPVPPAATLRPAPGTDRRVLVNPKGEVETLEQPGPRRPPAPKLGPWESRGTAALVAGTDPGYRPVPAVGTVARFDAGHGDAYGWLTLENPGAAAARAEPTVFPGGPGRLHVFVDGERAALVGEGAGADCDPVEVGLGGRVTFLTAGGARPATGLPAEQAPGLAAAPMGLKPVELGEPEVTTTRAPSPFKVVAYVPGRSTEDTPLGSRVAYSVRLTGKKPLHVRGLVEALGTVVLNGTPVARFGPEAGDGCSWAIDPGAENSPMRSGTNELVFHFDAVVDDPAGALAKLRLFREEGERTPAGRGVWSFCPWRAPSFGGDAAPPGKPKSRGKAADAPAADPGPVEGQPVWHRCSFSTRRLDFPLHLEPVGLTRGVVILNGHPAARYHVAVPGEKAPKKVEPLSLPTGWLNREGDNELLVFDEHGGGHDKVKLRWG